MNNIVSVIIPILKAENIEPIIESIPNKYEVILASSFPFKINSGRKHLFVLSDSSNRSDLMNTGAKRANGDVFLFLHPDTYITEEALTMIEKLPGDYIGGGVNMVFYPRTFFLNINSFFANIRMRLFNSIYGDQCCFVREEIFWKISGFKSLSICEDLEFSQRLKRHGRLRYFNSCQTSARRFQNRFIRQVLVNNVVRIGFHLGISNGKLRRIYG